MRTRNSNQTADLLQGSILGPVLYLWYTSHVPTILNYMIASYADDTAILKTKESSEKSTEALQAAVDSAISWAEKLEKEQIIRNLFMLCLQAGALLKQIFT